MDAGPGTRGSAERALVALGVALACIAAALVTTWASLDAWFVGDDLGEVQRALHGDDRGAHVRPLVTFGLRADHALGGLDPRGYHAVNVALHAVVIGLVGWVAAGLADRAGATGTARRLLPWAAGATFAVLATHAEAVSWISTRGDLVATGGALVAVGAWSRRDGRARWTAVAALALLVALGAKEHAAVIPLLCIVVGLGPGAPSVAAARRAVRDAAPLLAMLAGYVVVRALVLGSLVGSYSDDGGFDWHPVRVVAGLAAKAVRTVVPGTDPAGWFGVAALVALALAVVAGHRGAADAWRSPCGGVARTSAVLAVVALLPSAGLGVSLTDGRGDRLLHMASAFAAVAVASAAVALVDAIGSPGRRAAALGVIGVAVVLSGRAAIERDQRWAEAGDLAAATLADGDRWDRPRQVVVVNPADTVRGAYAHRNALGDAGVVVHGWEAPSQVAGLVPTDVEDAAGGMEVTRVGDRRWELRPAPGSEVRLPDGDDGPWSAHGVTASRGPEGTLAVEVAPGVDLADVWVLRDGAFTDLASAG